MFPLYLSPKGFRVKLLELWQKGRVSDDLLSNVHLENSPVDIRLTLITYQRSANSFSEGPGIKCFKPHGLYSICSTLLL